MKTIHYRRWQEKIIRSALKTRRILILSGPRQCGKTTLAKKIADSNSIYRNLDDLTLFEAAQSDPETFIKHDKNLMIIDEIQKIPELLSVIKSDVDRDETPGRYLLTGSSNIHSLPQASESLAGRVRRIRLRPLSVGEYKETSPSFLKKAFEEKFEKDNHHRDKDSYLSLAFKGNFPEPLRLKDQKEIHQWYQDYIHSLLEKDLKDILNIRRHASMEALLEVLAAYSSKAINISKIGSTLSIQRPTIESYINVLEALYLSEEIRPWTKTDYDRIRKKNKFFITDTGIMTSLLNWKFGEVRLDRDRSGKLIETFVFNQLMAIVESQETPYNVFSYRDQVGHEVDFLIENSEGGCLGIEVKAGARVGRENFKHLKWFKENMFPKKNFIGIVLYTGREVFRFEEGMWAVPISSLWEGC